MTERHSAVAAQGANRSGGGPGAVQVDRRERPWRRLDTEYGHLTLFDPLSGNKLRLGAGAVDGTATPELVDIKLTERCHYGCTFCYMGSTPEGRDASLGDLSWLAHTLGQAGVLEAAFGGGEPTLHPHFLTVLRQFRDAGVVPNFTTRNLGYLRRHWDALQEVMGGFAASVESAQATRRVAQALRGLERRTGQANLHVVMGLVERRELQAIFREAHEADLRVTLLGYKTTGRGSEVQPQAHEWWIEDVLRAPCDVSIDTALAEIWEDELLRSGVARPLFHTREGIWSAYIDAVRMTLHPSSYDQSEGRPLGAALQEHSPWQAHFAQIANEARSRPALHRG